MPEISATSLNVSVRQTKKRRKGPRPHRAIHGGDERKQKHEIMLKGVEALVRAPKGSDVIVSGATFCVDSWENKQRVYHLKHASPGSPLAISGDKKTMILHDHLYASKAPPESEVGFGGVLMWEHLVRNGIKEYLNPKHQKPSPEQP